MSDNNTPETVIVDNVYDDEMLCDVDDESMANDNKSVTETSLAKNESKYVSVFRIVLLVVLVATALVVSLVAYFASHEGEVEEFESTFNGHADKIIESFKKDAEQKRTALLSLAVAFTSHATHANETWPFVTLPDFEFKAHLVREMAEVISVMILPIVQKDELEAWGDHVVANQDWFWDGLVFQERLHGPGAMNLTAPEEAFFSKDIFTIGQNGSFDPSENEDGPFFPVWQNSPQLPIPLVNADFGSMEMAEAELHAFVKDERRRNIVGPAIEFEEGNAGFAYMNALLQFWNDGGNSYSGGPISFYNIPMYLQNELKSSFVGVVQALVYWETYLEGLLPSNANGIVTVLENTCGQSFTYSISGSKAKFVEDGDVHDKKYNYLERQTEYGDFLQRDEEVDLDGCFYRLRIYPSKEMEDYYVTNEPLYFCLSMMGLFLFTALAFVLYDRFVEKRQRLVMKTAVQSSNVVNKLFPDTVVDRLYQTEEDTRVSKKADTKGQFLTGNKTRLSTVLGNASDGSTASSQRLQGQGSPIADEFGNCTVYFADLAGFTKWSSTRTPIEVFHLLETLYGAFDKVAKRLGVFKVETIGDCYVAVTGLPQPQENHALIMTRFAAICMSKMNQIVNSDEIISELGEDTTLLEMRVGLHSGPVTAGVLRGEKARFQLFGDSVNTASRMESNGKKGCIQVSQTTADLLVDAGKSSWLKPREELVAAKGKGFMQTYWVTIPTDTSSRVSGSVVSMALEEQNELRQETNIQPSKQPMGGDPVSSQDIRASYYVQEVEV